MNGVAPIIQAMAAVSVGNEIDDMRWYVVQAQPGAESRAAQHLERQGYPTFYPRYRKTIRHARERISTMAPLFPSYLFVGLDASRDRWRSVNGTRGVVRLLTQGDIPSPVPRGMVEALRERTNADGAIDWAPGQVVRVAEGPFEDFVGTLTRLDGAGRVCVLLDILGRTVSMTVRCEALDPVA
jgi:transcription elongation factor/antiterminator RfaH